MTIMEHLMRPLHVNGVETPPLRLIRYALSGSLAGIACVGTFQWIAGVQSQTSYDVAGAIVGFAAVLLVKFLRIA